MIFSPPINPELKPSRSVCRKFRFLSYTPLRDTPFRVVDDEEMMKTAESVRDFGVLTPAIVRPDPDGGYENRFWSQAGTGHRSLRVRKPCLRLFVTWTMMHSPIIFDG